MSLLSAGLQGAQVDGAVPISAAGLGWGRRVRGCVEVINVVLETRLRLYIHPVHAMNRDGQLRQWIGQFVHPRIYSSLQEATRLSYTRGAMMEQRVTLDSPSCKTCCSELHTSLKIKVRTPWAPKHYTRPEASFCKDRGSQIRVSKRELLEAASRRLNLLCKI